LTEHSPSYAFGFKEPKTKDFTYSLPIILSLTRGSIKITSENEKCTSATISCMYMNLMMAMSVRHM
jgi:hypothetical protein